MLIQDLLNKLILKQTHVKYLLVVSALVTPICANAHDDIITGDDQINQIVVDCELKRDSSAAELIGADEYVESCVTSDLNRLGKLRKFKEEYPKIYAACHEVQPYGLSAAVICIESMK